MRFEGDQMNVAREKRALVLFGAGASVEFGAPSTSALTKEIEKEITTDEWMKSIGGDTAFQEISSKLASYFNGGSSVVNFEHIFHCAHQLLSVFPPSNGAVNEYRPVLVPFLKPEFVADDKSLSALTRFMAEQIFARVSETCKAPKISLDPFQQFIERLRSDHIFRGYSTNYDDFPLQAVADLYVGFDDKKSAVAKRFDGHQFWQSTDRDCLYHLHGSVHLGFDRSPSGQGEIGELFWFDDRNDALGSSSYHGSGMRQMDGSDVSRSPIITGFDKLARLQQRPLSYFYSALAQDALAADIIYIVGSGLTDLHVNAWIGEARRQKTIPPIVMVDWWKRSFAEETAFDYDRKVIEMWHSLRMSIGYEPQRSTYYGTGWTISRDKSCAVWDKGFQAFLNAPEELDVVLAQLTKWDGSSGKK
jgi:SIR2-like domain